MITQFGQILQAEGFSFINFFVEDEDIWFEGIIQDIFVEDDAVSDSVDVFNLTFDM